MSGGLKAKLPASTPPIEAAVGLAGGVLLLAMVGYLLFLTFGGAGERPVDLTMERGAAQESAAGYRLPVTLRNLGDEPAEQVVLRAVLTLPGGETEQAELTLPFLAPRGEAEGGFFFKSNPEDGDLELSAIGYLRP